MQSCVSIKAPEMHFIGMSLYCTVKIIFEIEDFIIYNLILHMHAAQLTSPCLYSSGMYSTWKT